MHITITLPKVIAFAIFMLIVVFKTTSLTDNLFSSYGENTRLAQVMNDNKSLNGGV